MVETVETRRISETAPVFAQIVTARDGSVASRVSGNVDTVHVLAGDRVEVGDPLVELDAELLEILVAQSEAQAAEAEAGIETARVQVDRTQKAFDRIAALEESSSFSQGRYDEAQSDMLEARTELVRAQARLKSSQTILAENRYQLENSRIRAPFSGVVISVETIPGAFIQAGAPIVRLIDTNAFEVEASVPARYVRHLVPGQIVEASLENGKTVPLEVRAILPLEDPATRTRAVRFTGNGLGEVDTAAVGQSLTVDVAVGEAQEVLSVPKDALVQASGGWRVFVAVDGKAEARSVTIGLPLGDRYEVLDGLQEGEEVVVRGNERLRPGQEIAASPANARQDTN
jgi:RND family efflux transporter MFP subunit